jgi:hypothetical protein
VKFVNYRANIVNYNYYQIETSWVYGGRSGETQEIFRFQFANSGTEGRTQYSSPYWTLKTNRNDGTRSFVNTVLH